MCTQNTVAAVANYLSLLGNPVQ